MCFRVVAPLPVGVGAHAAVFPTCSGILASGDFSTSLALNVAVVLLHVRRVCNATPITPR